MYGAVEVYPCHGGLIPPHVPHGTGTARDTKYWYDVDQQKSPIHQADTEGHV